MNNFTQGEWQTDGVFVYDSYVIATITSSAEIGREESQANAQLIVTAGNSATKLAEQGYDAVKLIEQLPDIIARLQSADEAQRQYHEVTRGKGNFKAKYNAACDLAVMDVASLRGAAS